MGSRISIDDDVVASRARSSATSATRWARCSKTSRRPERHAAALQRLVIELQGRLDAWGKAPGHVRTPGASITMAVASATSGPLVRQRPPVVHDQRDISARGRASRTVVVARASKRALIVRCGIGTPLLTPRPAILRRSRVTPERIRE